MRRGRGAVAALLAAALVLTVAGCSSSDDPKPEECVESPAGTVSAEQAAACTYQAWITNNIVMLSSYSAPGATDALPGVADDPKMTFEGCAGNAADDETVCTWSGAFTSGTEKLRLHVTGDGTAGYRVTAAEL